MTASGAQDCNSGLLHCNSIETMVLKEAISLNVMDCLSTCQESDLFVFQGRDTHKEGENETIEKKRCEKGASTPKNK